MAKIKAGKRTKWIEGPFVFGQKTLSGSESSGDVRTKRKKSPPKKIK